ncbi:hypothetical protein HK44_003870 [Pseudomonas fluorescens HK44]|uniref:Uncharacterized protein n=1 Tax=Pseudomonas fluorescens HK44 TaxID=1042209 RepID=A0A010SSV6_PSEFL|nr:hypothetical protein HK44_003870 [Pseudomonas fluorescens HK44]
MLNNRFLGVFRGQAPSITLQLPMDTRGESHRTRHEKTDLSSTGLMYWKMCSLGLDLSVFRGAGTAKAKERLFFGRKKWTSFQRSIF